jgi:hypothetical protein
LSTDTEPWLLRRPVFLILSFLVAAIATVVAYWLYIEAGQGPKFVTKLREQLLQIWVVVLAGIVIKEIVDWRTGVTEEYARKAELRREFLSRLQKIHVIVAYAHDLMRAHRSPKTWSEQSRNLMKTIAEVKEIIEDLRASPDLFRDQADILAAIEKIVSYLSDCRDEYIENHRYVDSNWKEEKGLDHTVQEQQMDWTRDFLAGTGSYQSEYLENLQMAKLPMRQAVFGSDMLS